MRIDPIVMLFRGPRHLMDAHISIGGPVKEHYYCVYRGDLDASIEAVEHALHRLKLAKLQGEPPLTDPQKLPP